MFLIIALSFVCVVYILSLALKQKYEDLKNKVYTTNANIIIQPEVHTNFEIIPAIPHAVPGQPYTYRYIYGVKNKTIYYCHRCDYYHKPVEPIIRTKDSNWDVSKTGYELCSFRQTATGWILMYMNTSNRKVLFSIRDDSFNEIRTYGDYTYSMFFRGTIYACVYPYIWISPKTRQGVTPGEVVKMNIENGSYTYADFPNFDADYSFTGTIFSVAERKIFIPDFALHNIDPQWKYTPNFYIFYDGTYIYYIPESIYEALGFSSSLGYTILPTSYPMKAVKIND